MMSALNASVAIFISTAYSAIARKK